MFGPPTMKTKSKSCSHTTVDKIPERHHPRSHSIHTTETGFKGKPMSLLKTSFSLVKQKWNRNVSLRCLLLYIFGLKKGTPLAVLLLGSNIFWTKKTIVLIRGLRRLLLVVQCIWRRTGLFVSNSKVSIFWFHHTKETYLVHLSGIRLLDGLYILNNHRWVPPSPLSIRTQVTIHQTLLFDRNWMSHW